MKLRNYPKYHYTNQFYKRNTGYYDHYNNDDFGYHPSIMNGKGCLISILFIIFAFVFLFHSAYSGSVNSWIGGTLLFIGFFLGCGSV